MVLGTTIPFISFIKIKEEIKTKRGRKERPFQSTENQDEEGIEGGVGWIEEYLLSLCVS